MLSRMETSIATPSPINNDVKIRQSEAARNDQASNDVNATLPTERELDLARFCSVYSSIPFSTIASECPSPSTAPSGYGSLVQTGHLEDELSSLISSGLLANSRLDIVDRNLVSLGGDSRQAPFTQALEAAAEIEHAMLLKLHQANVLLAGLVVKR